MNDLLLKKIYEKKMNIKKVLEYKGFVFIKLKDEKNFDKYIIFVDKKNGKDVKKLTDQISMGDLYASEIHRTENDVVLIDFNKEHSLKKYLTIKKLKALFVKLDLKNNEFEVLDAVNSKVNLNKKNFLDNIKDGEKNDKKV